MTNRSPTSESPIQPQALLAESVLLLERFRAGEEAAATEIFERFAQRLAALVQSRLSKQLARRLDAEDVVLSAYRSFFVRARSGHFSLDEPGDLWRLLAQITLNKLYRSAEWHNAARRTPAREQPGLVELGNRAADAESSPELAVVVADQLEFLMSQLPPATCRVLELQLQGHDADEIATMIGRSPRTVRRQLEAIRAAFVKQVGNERVVASTPDPSESTSITATSGSLAQERTLAEFVLRRQIGLGLTGRVYEAFDKQQQKLVAVKVLRKSLLADLSLRERFEAEANIVARLDHPGIIRIHGHGKTPNGGWFIVMDLLPGGDLTSQAGLSLPVAQATDWIRQVARAVAYAHENGIVHCDLKPANLLLAKDGYVIVTDFGFAQTREQELSSYVAGTPAFMAPEQIDRVWGPIGPRTDVYGLGAVLYFLLTGSSPVAGSRIQDVLADVLSSNEIPSVIKLRADVPGWLADVCQCSLRKLPGNRFESVAALLAAFPSATHEKAHR